MSSDVVFNDDLLSLPGYASPGYYKMVFYEFRAPGVTRYDPPFLRGMDTLTKMYKELIILRAGNGLLALVCAQTFQELKTFLGAGKTLQKVVHSMYWTTLANIYTTRGGLPHLVWDAFDDDAVVYRTPLFQCITPINEWFYEPGNVFDGVYDYRVAYHFTKVPAINYLTVSYGAAGTAPLPGTMYYGVIKGTGYDFWVLREHSMFFVVNAGVFAGRIGEFVSEFEVTACPPNWCDFLTVHEVPDDFLQNELKFNTVPHRRAPELFGALYYRQRALVTASTIPFTVKVHRKNRRRLVTKKLSAECSGCDWTPSHPQMYPSCSSRRCAKAFCKLCYEKNTQFGYLCECGAHKTFEWLSEYGRETVDFVKIELYGEDSPGSLTVLAAGAVRRYHPADTLSAEHLPRELLHVVAQCDLLDYWHEG